MPSKRVPTAQELPELDLGLPPRGELPVVPPTVDPDAADVEIAPLGPLGPPPPDDATAAFLRGQGAEGVVPAPGPDLWMLEPCTRARRVAFLESLGARFAGDIPGITVYVLDRWSEQPMGFRFTLDPGAPAVPVVSPRAEALLIRCFVRTRMGLYKRAVAEHAGDLDAAIRASVHEMMTLFGLEASLGLPEEEAIHG